jgi:hypothetical protein
VPVIQLSADLFAIVWPHFERYLNEPRSEEEVAIHFDLAKAQVRQWLTRALAEKRVKRLGRPARYRSSGDSSAGRSRQHSLFDGERT